ncbi:MAG: transporter substrate-binding protein, partial [Clostridia bacterium]|nr:transporter substrate-binding protein [Clostridia bacterium]
MKKIIALLLILCMTGLFLSACNDENIDDAKEPEVEEFPDLEGYAFKFRYTDNEHGTFNPVDGETIIGDNTLIRYKEVETNFNCIMDLEKYDHAKFREAVIVGDDYADLIYLNITNIFDLYADKLLYCLDDIEGMDFSTEKFGYRNLLDAASIKGQHYGFFPLYWGMPTAGYKNVFYFNNANLKKFGQPLPHEFLEKNQWTWDT